MFRKNDQHLQEPLFSSIDSLPDRQRRRLDDSWAKTYYDQVFVRINESPFAVLYVDEPSRPNIPINVLVSLDTLKSGHGWSDEEMYDHFSFDVQVRYALGYRDLSEGHFAIRTVYNFRERITRHMEETGENLYERAFEQITDEQLAAFELKTERLRVDSTQIASNIRTMSRLQLLVEILQRVHRMLSQDDQQRYREAFEPYTQGSSGQYTYRIKVSETGEHLHRIGELMDRLVRELCATYATDETYQILRRVFQEHFVVESASEASSTVAGDDAVQQTLLRAKEGQELSASSLQSPDDPEATYRQKHGRDYKGYVTNLTETCAPGNNLQLIVKVQTEPNHTDDAAMLAEALPDLVKRTDVNQVYTDGAYNSPAVDDLIREHHIEQIQTAIRGRKPPQDKLGLADLTWQTDADGKPQAVTCPYGQHVPVTAGRKAHRFCATFHSPDCQGCSWAEQCPAKQNRRKTRRVLRFSQHQVDLALRRQQSAQARASGQDLRAAVEATVRSVKHPFGNGKVPVRGKSRVSMVMVGAALMSNLRRIHRYLVDQNRPGREQKAIESRVESTPQQPALLFSSRFRVFLRSIFGFQPACAGLF